MNSKTKNYILLLTRICDICVGIISMFIIVVKTAPEIYALLGIATIFGSVMLMIPNLGFETIFIRNHLYWSESGNKSKSNLYYTLAIKSKVYVGLAVSTVLFIVSIYYANYKFKNIEHAYVIMVVFIITSFINTLSDTCQLLLIGNGNYLEININRFLLITCYKLILILNFNRIGAINYIILMQSNIIFVCLINYIMLKRKIGLKFNKEISVKELVREVKTTKNFIIENYLRLIGNYLDQMIFSVILPINVFSSYNLAKTLENIFVQVIDIYFDPLTQELVKYKQNIEELKKRYKKIAVNRIKLIILLILGYIFYVIVGSYMLSIMKLDKYLFLKYFINFSIVNITIYLLYKPECNIISLFFHSKYKVIISSTTIINLIVYLVIINIDFKYAYLIRTSYQFLNLIVVFSIYLHKGGIKNEKNIYCDV